jgi:hypothetical protein
MESGHTRYTYMRKRQIREIIRKQPGSYVIFLIRKDTGGHW